MRGHLRSTRAAVAALGAVLLLASGAQARPPHHGECRFLEHHAEQLGLDAEQREAISELMERSSEESTPLREDLHELRQGLHRLLQAETPEAEAVMAQADAIGAAETRLHKLRLETMMGIHAQLTAEQRTELKELRGALRDFAGEELDDACAGDVAEFCPKARDRLTRAHCLRENRGDVSEGCTDALRCARCKHFDRDRHHRRHGSQDSSVDSVDE